MLNKISDLAVDFRVTVTSGTNSNGLYVKKLGQNLDHDFNEGGCKLEHS